MKKISLLFFSALFFISCAAVEEGEERGSTMTYPPMFYANSLDLAVLGDPFFTALFNDERFSHGENFYLSSFQYGMNAELFSTIDAALLSGLELEDEFTPFLSSLSNLDFYRIAHAKTLIFSPLLTYLQPQLAEQLKSERERIGKTAPVLFSFETRDRSPYNLSVDFSYALREMAIEIAETFSLNPELNELIVFADANIATKAMDDIQLILRMLNRLDQHISINVYWNKRNVGEEQKTSQGLYNVNRKTAVYLLHVSSHINSALQYLFSRREEWKGRVFIVQYWKLNHDLAPNTAVAGVVEAGEDVFFRKKNYTYARFRRYK